MVFLHMYIILVFTEEPRWKFVIFFLFEGMKILFWVDFCSMKTSSNLQADYSVNQFVKKFLASLLFSQKPATQSQPWSHEFDLLSLSYFLKSLFILFPHFPPLRSLKIYFPIQILTPNLFIYILRLMLTLYSVYLKSPLFD